MNEHNNNPNNINTTEDSLFADMPELISDTDSEPYSDTDYSDMPELISIDETELINRLTYSFQ